MIENHNIICFAPTDWWGMNPSCTTHIMQKLSEKNKVLYINPFSSDLFGVAESRVIERFVRKTKSIIKFFRQQQKDIKQLWKQLSFLQL